MTQYLGRIKMGGSCQTLVTDSAYMYGTVGMRPGKDWKWHQRASARQGHLASRSKWGGM